MVTRLTELQPHGPRVGATSDLVPQAPLARNLVTAALLGPSSLDPRRPLLVVMPAGISGLSSGTVELGHVSPSERGEAPGERPGPDVFAFPLRSVPSGSGATTVHNPYTVQTARWAVTR